MNPLKDFFYYNRGERNGVLLLLGIILILWVLPYFFASWMPKQEVDFESWQADVAVFEDGLSAQTNSYQPYSGNATPKEADKPLQPFAFDPNTISETEMNKMVLPARTIKSILNYRAKGGKFKTKESLQKIYTLSEEHYQQLMPFIQLKTQAEALAKGEKIEPIDAPKPLPKPFDFDPNLVTAEELEALGLPTNTIRSIINYREKGGQFRQKEDFKKIYNLPDSIYQHLQANIQIVAQPKVSNNPAYTPKTYYKIDINTATTEDFQQFKGIGVSYANRILKMRESLGGFVSVEQIGEIYKLPDSTFQGMKPYLECAPMAVRKININTATVEELQTIPYLRWFHAKAIVKYRETEGAWKSVDLLQILPEFDDGKGTFKKAKPYLICS